MAIRKVWVKRANASSATQVAIGPDELVDDVRDAVIRKYLNSLGRTFDAPDVSLKICPREQTNKAGNERLLAPDEPIIRLLDAYYPGGQTVDEALIIDVPHRRTPKPSPRPGTHMSSYCIPEEIRPGEAGDYFPPMPALQSPHLNSHNTLPASHPTNSHLHSMTVLTTGQVPPLPSPGGRSNRHRPKAGRQHTSSPTILHSAQVNSNLLGMTERSAQPQVVNSSSSPQTTTSLRTAQLLLQLLRFPLLRFQAANPAIPSHHPYISPHLNPTKDRRMVNEEGLGTSSIEAVEEDEPTTFIVLRPLHQHLQASWILLFLQLMC
jgi:osomolarity two-component system, response regulator SSK1